MMRVPKSFRFWRRLLLACGIAVSGCSSTDPLIYAGQQPTLALHDYFNGTVDAWGMFTNRSGEVVKRFTVVIRGDWKIVDGVRIGTLDEDFHYADGTTQKRIWTIREVGPNRYVGTAGDVVGEAQGVAAGNALHWSYTLALPVSGNTWNMQFDDWMFQMDQAVMLNRAVMSKFGIRLGDVTLAFRKREPA